MQFSTTIFSATVLLLASQAMGAAVNAPNEVEAREINIATTPEAACNCPNNCDYDEGHSCRFYGGPSDNSKVFSGDCRSIDGKLKCIAN